MQTIILIIKFSIRIQTGIDSSTNTAIQVKKFKTKQYFPYLSIVSSVLDLVISAADFPDKGSLRILHSHKDILPYESMATLFEAIGYSSVVF